MNPDILQLLVQALLEKLLGDEDEDLLLEEQGLGFGESPILPTQNPVTPGKQKGPHLGGGRLETFSSNGVDLQDPQIQAIISALRAKRLGGRAYPYMAGGGGHTRKVTI